MHGGNPRLVTLEFAEFAAGTGTLRHYDAVTRDRVGNITRVHRCMATFVGREAETRVPCACYDVIGDNIVIAIHQIYTTIYFFPCHVVWELFVHRAHTVHDVAIKGEGLRGHRVDSEQDEIVDHIVLK
jgi:hypothetical protein